MQVIFTANEINAAYAMSKMIAKEVGTFLTETDPYVALRKEKFVTIGDNGDVTMEVPEEFMVEYFEMAGRYNRQLVQIGKTIWSIAQTVKGLFGDFEKDLQKLLKKFNKPAASAVAE